jgi:hypothetical protein
MSFLSIALLWCRYRGSRERLSSLPHAVASLRRDGRGEGWPLELRCLLWGSVTVA